MSIIDPFRRLPSTAYLSSLAHLALEFSQNFMPVVYPLIIESMGLNYAKVGTLALTASLSASLMQPLFGFLSDKWDPRLIILLSVSGSAVVMGMVGMIGFHSDQYLLLLPIIAMGGLASAAFHPAGAALATSSIIRRRGAALSIFSVGGNLGSALSPVAVGVGLAWIGLRGTTLLIPIGLLLGLFLYRSLAEGSSPSQASLSEVQAAEGPPVIEVGSWLAIALIIVIVAARSWFQGALITYMPEWLQSEGRSLEAAGSILSTLLVSTSIGSLSGGTLSDRVGTIPIVLVSLVLLGPMHWLFLNSGGLLQVASASIMGALIGSTFPVAIVLAQEALPSKVGLASSLVLGLGWLPAGIGSWLIGVVADRTTLTFALSSLAFVPMIGVVSGLTLRWRRMSS